MFHRSYLDETDSNHSVPVEILLKCCVDVVCANRRVEVEVYRYSYKKTGSSVLNGQHTAGNVRLNGDVRRLHDCVHLHDAQVVNGNLAQRMKVNDDFSNQQIHC